MDYLISLTSHIIIFVGLYFTCFWILTMLNINQEEKKFIVKKWPSVSILVPAYNEEKTLINTINSILKSNYKGIMKVIIVNDASQDDTINIAKKLVKGNKKIVSLVDLKKNQGKAGAINKAIKNVDTEFMAIIDADTTINKDTIEEAIRIFCEDENKEIGVVMCQMKPINENKNILERIQLIEYMMVGLIRFLNASQRLLHMTNGGSFYRTEIVKKLKGFDRNNLTEDFEMGVKVRRSHKLVVYASKSKVFTNTPNKFKTFLNQRLRWSRGFIQTHRKHKDIFFNKVYGLFGMYQFPMNIIGPILYFMAIFVISYNIYKKIYEFIFKLINTPDVISWFEFDSIRDYILTIDPTIDLIIFASFIFLMFLYYGVIRFYDYNYFKKDFFKKAFAFFIYIMVYNYVYIYVWIVSIKREMSGAKYNWGTK